MDNESLEGALNKATSKENKVEISKEEEIGFYKGAFNTLIAERAELVKMIGNVETIMQMHIKRMKELGVDLK